MTASPKNHLVLPLIAAAIVFVSCAWIKNSRPGWNANSQFALTLAIVEQGTLRIDHYHADPIVGTGDKAFYEGHFYSDKSPVTAFLGVPAMAAYSAITRMQGEPIDYADAWYWTTLGSVGICAALYTFLLASLLIWWGMAPSWAAFVSMAWFLGTPLYGYSIIFFNYLPACVFALGGYMLIDPWIRNVGESAGGFPGWKRLGTAGVLIGLACWTLQTVGLFAIILTLALAVLQIRRFDLKEEWKLWPWAVGGITGASGYVFYTLAIFGHVANPYTYEYDSYFRESMQHGFMGASWPDLRIIWMLTFHPFRGLFTLFPITLAAMIGSLWLVTRRSMLRAPAVIAISYMAAMILYNSGYYMWWGGWAYAPRHLIVALAILPIGFIPLINMKGYGKGITTILLSIVIALSIVMNIGVIALDPQPQPMMPDEALHAPEKVGTWTYPNFELMKIVATGELDRNIGKDLGLNGLMSLVPLILLWVCGFGLFIWTGRTDTKPTAAE